MPAYSDDSATFAISVNQLIANPSSPDVSTYGSTTQNVTIVATK